MNGPEHYKAAEELTRDVHDLLSRRMRDVARTVERDPDLTDATDAAIDRMTALAQVHATLAQTAATIDASGWVSRSTDVHRRWREALGG